MGGGRGEGGSNEKGKEEEEEGGGEWRYGKRNRLFFFRGKNQRLFIMKRHQFRF